MPKTNRCRYPRAALGAAALRHVHRRAFLGRAAGGLGSVALASLLNPSLLGDQPLRRTTPLPQGTGGFPTQAPKVRRVIFLYMSGGPSHLETFDNKPQLGKLHGQPMPDSVTAGQPIAQLQGQKLVCQAPMFPFRRWGRSGQEITELFPYIGSVADEICILRSMHTDQINHDPAHMLMNTGTSIPGRPSMGAWVTYGLGSEAADLPGFVVLTSFGGRSPQPISARQWAAGFLPSRYQGVEFRSTGDAVLYAGNPAGVSGARQRDVVDAVTALDRLGDGHQAASGRRQPPGNAAADPEVAARISQYEMAFRMQMSVPELMDISREPRHVLEMYGASGPDGSFAYNCLLARRLAERGVRFIQLYHRDWDHHNDLVPFMKVCSGLCDRPTAALIRDLQQRGMLEDTLIVWGGEFGRTPMAQSNKGAVGRDHHMRAFSMFLAGGGVRGGITYGATDDLGYHAAMDPVHVNDLHATVLHLLGIDHRRLTYRFQGRDFRLTDVGGRVVKEVLT
jgi:hypothetical protein